MRILRKNPKCKNVFAPSYTIYKTLTWTRSNKIKQYRKKNYLGKSGQNWGEMNFVTLKIGDKANNILKMMVSKTHIWNNPAELMQTVFLYKLVL